MNSLFYLALALIFGLASTRLAKLVKLPNVTGYLVAGLLIGPSVFGVVSHESVESFNIIVTLALGFIAFSIGGEFKLDVLKRLGKNVVVITAVQAFGTVIAVFAVLYAAGACGLLGENYLPMVFTLSAIATATAPAATLLVVRQYKARGPVTETLLPVVAMDDAFGLMIFSIFISIAQAFASGTNPTVHTMLLEPLRELVLSLIIGAAIGLVVSLCSRVFKSRANRLCLCIAATVLGVALSEMWHLSSLLLCMMIGAVFSNLGRDVDKILDGADRWTPPVFMLFFVISGMELDLSILPTVGVLGALYIISRSIGKYFGARFGAAMVNADKNIRKYLGLTLLPQAGVAVGMAQIALSRLPAEFGTKIQAVVLCATLVYEIVGPVITKIALQKAGEIKSGS